MDSGDIFPKRGKIALGHGETSSAISKNDYEVFLSFRGHDTRQGFTDCLYHALIDAGIGVFRDDDELALGDKIDDILIALNNSKICIVVLSPTFAKSVWCLREVERMVDMKKDIVPLFYHVTPDDVKLKTELYANALTMHETKHGKEKVRKWRDSLKEIPSIKGRELKNTGYGEFSKQVAKEILTKLKVKFKYEIKNLVEVPDEVESALELLDIGSGGRRVVGIHGMGGIGKTTLAKIIFNQILDTFDCSCFLENIRDYISQGPDGLHKLQERLLKSLDPSARDNTQIVDPMKRIQTIFQRKKVVIVLDDVDQQSHLDSLVGDSSWFGNGSRIIFTTRNATLHEETSSSNADFYGLEKKEMDSKQSLKLFSRHAFGGDSPPKEFEVLSIEAISTTGGLPLALEVVGSFLHRRKAKVWRETINKLKESPHEDVQRKLKLSYDALEDKQKEIFLDIACFFIGEEKANAIYMWRACKFYPNEGIDVLISMSLIKLNERKCFWMHDQLRDLGRAIVQAAGSRLWMHKDALDLLKTNGGKERVEALHLDGDCVDLDRENFVGLEKLRFLRMKKPANFDGDFSGLIPKLRWMSLLIASSFNVTNLYLRELVVLELSGCKFDETWPGWGQILISEQLKVLTLSDCNKLISTPDLSKVVNLERLVVERCSKLTSLHSSIGKLQCLRHLSIIECDSLHELPEEFSSLASLKHISTMSSQVQLPNSIGRLESLTRLELCGVIHLPNSIGELVKLKHLSLDSYSIRVLPDCIGDLKSLIRLNLSETVITELPTTIGGLAKLESLNLSECSKLQRLPDSIGNLQSLVDLKLIECESFVELPHSLGNLASLNHLNLSCTMITELPTTIGGLAKLESLYLIDCIKLQRLPDSIENLQSLVDLDMSRCQSIHELPHLFGNLSSLQKLNLMDSGIRSLPDSIRRLERLERLDIGDSGEDECTTEEDVNWMRELPELPSGLTCLNVGNVQKIQNLANLINLSELEIRNGEFICNQLVEFKGIEELSKLKRLFIECSNVQSLSMEWVALQQLKSLTLWCPSLEFGHCQLPWSLESLDLSVKKWGNLPSNLSSLKNLSELRLTNFVIEEADLVEGLRSLYLYKCYFPTMACLRIPPQLNQLVDLIIENCDNLVDIQGNLKSLTKLGIFWCDNLVEIQDIGNLKSSTNVNIVGCPSFKMIEMKGSSSWMDFKQSILFRQFWDSADMCPRRG